MATNCSRICKLLLLGRTPYVAAWKLQQEISSVRRSGRGDDTLILLEHEPVYTMGRSGSQDNVKASPETLLAAGLEVIEVDRGGDVTYHGPGQLVGYPVLDLKGYGQDLHHYSWMLEEVIIRTLAKYGIRSFRETGLTGVWTEKGKIAAIGIGVRNWVSIHGFSLNINPDMWYFSLINPCGITNRPVATMRDFGIDTSLDEVRGKLEQQFSAVFNVQLLPVQEDCVDELISARTHAVG
ncbi:Octanoyltransferase [Sporomusa ovata DSM 2662]|uniref:lipoyl(octanoyl) transferase LipB n=1 Tax=Sporomusa ovata TaxID=2378 RepID=UPI00038867D5|nr:lipoyl(octanoyl) transferase LipB [Sporomusa ovata]EQB24551.1 lipoyl(octanoyl) transferase LipB [Sporomusa ovata DSM 2662]